MTSTQDSELRTGHSTTGQVVVISGPSGVGKGTICRELVRRLEDVFLSVSATTRPRAEAEVDGKDYWFISRQEFERRISQGLFLEYAEVFGNYYGTPRDAIDRALGQGRIVILEIDVQGGRKAKQAFPDAATIFILPPQGQALQQRLSGRGRDTAATMQHRLAKAEQEIAAARSCYEHFVVNDDLEKAVDQIVQIIGGCSSGRG